VSQKLFFNYLKHIKTPVLEKKKIYIYIYIKKPHRVIHACDPSTQRLSFISLRPAWATQEDPVSKKRGKASAQTYFQSYTSGQ
jgi:hypothetical protein